MEVITIEEEYKELQKDLLVGRTNRKVVGIDIGGTKMMLFLADEDGKIVIKRKVPTPHLPTPDQLFSSIIAHVDESLAQAGNDRSDLAAISIGLPGVIDYRNGIACNCTALGWARVDVGHGMQAHVDCPIFVENDVNLSALGEGWVGAAKGVKDFYIMAIGTGIGSAILSNGMLLHGGQYASGEVGYFVVDDTYPDEYQQDYSVFGRLESVASGSAITASAKQALIESGQSEQWRESYGVTADSVKADHVFQAAANGDKLALKILRQPLRHLSIALANVASLLNPELIVIGGGVASSGPMILSMLQNQVEKLSPNRVKLVTAQLGNEAGAAGAIYLALQIRKEQTDGINRNSSSSHA